ncbi:hypothetical protein RHAB21_01307 [Pseudorhizobium halotolerans]|uniref:O-antigen/teichoic acid export membrane protein n=1 Tax=Pseudorhizobium halotolerans TaxID=1233081 RepID=A0ABM8PFA7_9HYPH|nr:hypothetical protein [Pseudorhizobium halotolerans]CAD7026863.1 hypothetical protein RHAB21_01307 [Pseudorhizobium halotolerans]
MQYVAAISARYGALAIQFLLVLLVTDALPQDEAGKYFVAFGLATTLYCLPGLGLPDGLIKTVGLQLSNGSRFSIKTTLWRTISYSFISGAALLATGFYLGIVLGIDPQYALLTTIWCLSFGFLFVVTQCLVSLRRAGLAAFFFYTSTNIFSFFTSIPYLILKADPQLSVLLALNVVAASLSLVFALGALWRHTRRLPHTSGSAELRSVLQAGWFIAVSRFLQSALFWIPVWVATLCLGEAEAAVIGTAGRLVVAVAAVVAALRFSVRPAIVAAAAANDWRAIENTGRKIALFASASTVAAIVGTWFSGQWAIALLFGSDYEAVWPVLMVLLFGSLGETIGGPVDEVLKLTSHGKIVVFGLVATAATEAVLAVLLSPLGLLGIASAQAAAFWLMYSFQIFYLNRVERVLILPFYRS